MAVDTLTQVPLASVPPDFASRGLEAPCTAVIPDVTTHLTMTVNNALKLAGDERNEVICGFIAECHSLAWRPEVASKLLNFIFEEVDGSDGFDEREALLLSIAAEVLVAVPSVINEVKFAADAGQRNLTGTEAIRIINLNRLMSEVELAARRLSLPDRYVWTGRLVEITSFQPVVARAYERVLESLCQHDLTWVRVIFYVGNREEERRVRENIVIDTTDLSDQTVTVPRLLASCMLTDTRVIGELFKADILNEQDSYRSQLFVLFQYRALFSRRFEAHTVPANFYQVQVGIERQLASVWRELSDIGKTNVYGLINYLWATEIIYYQYFSNTEVTVEHAKLVLVWLESIFTDNLLGERAKMDMNIAGFLFLLGAHVPPVRRDVVTMMERYLDRETWFIAISSALPQTGVFIAMKEKLTARGTRSILAQELKMCTLLLRRSRSGHQKQEFAGDAARLARRLREFCLFVPVDWEGIPRLVDTVLQALSAFPEGMWRAYTALSLLTLLRVMRFESRTRYNTELARVYRALSSKGLLGSVTAVARDYAEWTNSTQEGLDFAHLGREFQEIIADFGIAHATAILLVPKNQKRLS